MQYNKIEKALVDLVISQVRSMAYLNIVLIITIGCIFYQVAHKPSLVLWVITGIVIATARIIIFPKLANGSLVPENYFLKECIAAIGFAFAGAHWGFAAWLFLDEITLNIYNFILAGSVLGVASVTIASSAARPKLWLAFGAVELGIVALKFVFLGYVPVVWMLILYTFSIFIIAKQIGSRIESSITKDFENEALLVELRKAKELAEQANIQKSQFMAATSHDLRQPLHAQGLLLEALKGKSLDSSDKLLVDKLCQSNIALEVLFDSLLEVSQLDAGTVSVHNCHQSLRSICQPVINEFQPEAYDKKLSIEYIGNDFIVISDPLLLTRIIRNLISNAIKYTEQGSISLQAEQHDDHIELSIQDTGIGIPENQFSFIFNEYTQLNNEARDRSKGVGLGLALVRRMCNLLQIPISVESTLEKGSTFKLVLPLGNLDKVLIEESVSLQSISEHLTVVLVDDDVLIIDAMTALFEKWNYTLLAFKRVEEAENALRDFEASIDLIISDYRLEDITGIDCINRLKKIAGENIPSILISGDTDPKLLRSIQDQGFYMLHKPLRPNLLKNAISRIFMTNNKTASSFAMN